VQERTTCLALHGADGAAEHVGGLPLRQALVVAKDHTGTLANRKPLDRAPYRVAVLDGLIVRNR
jgi:hypothetical protein